MVLAYQKRTNRNTYNSKYYSSELSRQKKRARDLKRRMLKYNADLESQITADVIQEVLEKYNYKCAYCGKDCKEKYHIDHKLPLCKGGSNNIDNLALSCPSCNLRKHDKTDVEFIGYAV